MKTSLLTPPFNSNIKGIFLFALWGCFIFASQSSFSQQVFPVSINGSLIPPHSSNLQDYSFDKSDDIMYMMTLIDPVEESRLVKFRLTVKNNGNPIIETNVNYNPAPVLLEKDIPLMLNGIDLAGYLDPMNLVQVNGGGQGGVLLPSGFNSICLEVIDIERGVPISDQYCLFGIFELSKPPLLNFPLCNSEIAVANTQNMMFSWNALHQLSLNQPAGVEYEFTLIKLFPGIGDPNDGFNLSTPIFQTTQTQTVLYYLEDNPQFEVGETYAWRVQVKDIFGNDLFENGGYSNVCTFTIIEDEDPPNLYTCESGNCNYVGEMSTLPFTGNIAFGDKVDIGNFEMTITQITGNNGFYSGEGTIYIPFIFSKLKVKFNDIQINEDLRIFNGSVVSTVDNNSLIPPMFSVDKMGDLAETGIDVATQVANGFTDATATALEDYFGGNGNNAHMVSYLEEITESDAIPIGLPIGIDKEIPELNSKLTIAISGIAFTPYNANLNAVLTTKFHEDGEWVKFGARGVCIQPEGIASANPQLELLNNIELEPLGAPITFIGIEDGESQTYLSFDCNGFEEFSLTGEYRFSKDLILPEDAMQDQVVARINATTRSLTDFIASVEPIGAFYFVGAEEFTFNIGSSSFDFSDTENPTGIVFPENFPVDQTGLDFKGFYLSDASVEFPDIFSTTTNGTLPQLIGNSILFTTDGFTGELLAENLIDLETGNLGGWGYSMDNAYLNIVNNSFEGSGFVGKMRLPIMRESESLKYQGNFAKSDNGLDISFDILPDLVTIDLLRAQIQFDANSKISVGRANGQFLAPTVDLSGLMTAAIPNGDPGFAGEVMNEIDNLKQALEDAGLGEFIPQLNLDGIKFEGFKIDLNAVDKFQIGSITPLGLDISFLGIDCGLDNMKFDRLNAEELANLNFDLEPNTIARALQFNMDFAKDLLGAYAPEIQFNLVINENTLNNGGGAGIPKFSFGGFDLNFDFSSLSSINCGNDLEPIDIDASMGNLATGQIQGQFETLQAGHFTLAPNFADGFIDNGNGTISGIGTIDVPILGPLSKLGVSFQNVKIDKTGRLVSGEIITDAEAGLFNSPQLGGLLSKVQGHVDNALSNVNEVLELPLVMGVKSNGENERDQGLILVGLVFGPTEAKAQAKVVFDIGNGEYAEFKAEGLTLIPDGIADLDVAVGLASDFNFTPMAGFNPLKFQAYDNINNTGSFVKLDCNGFLEFNLMGSYEFTEDQIVSLDNPGTPVNTTFQINSQKWGEFIGIGSGMGRFAITGLEGFDFEVSETYLDFSTEENITGVEFPEGYNQNVPQNLPNGWRGFFVKQIGLTLPEDFVLTPGTPRPEFTGSNLLIDPQGISTNLMGKNIVDGDVEGWAFALDSISVNIMANNLVESGVGGAVGIPIIDDELPFIGSLNRDNSGFYTMMLQPDGDATLNISALKSAINIGGQTEIVIRQEFDSLLNKKTFRPYADLYGGVGVTVTNENFNDPEFTGQTVQDVKEFVEDVLSSPIAFDPPSINFQGFKINHPSQPDGTTFSLDNYLATGGLQIGNHELNLNQLNMLESAAMPFRVGSDTLMLPGVGLGFKVGLPLVTFNVKFWAKEQMVNGKKKYSFGKIELETDLPRLDCGENLEEITIAANPILATGAVEGQFETLTVGHFVVTPSFPLMNDNSNGTITGRGTIDVPVLGPMSNISVRFDNVKIDQSGRIIEGEVITQTADNFDPENLEGVAGVVNTLLGKVGAGEVMENLKLPLVLGVKSNGETERDQGLILIGLIFKPTEAKAKAKVVFDIGNGDYAEFFAEGLTLVPDGIANFDLKVGLANDLNFRPMPNLNPLVFKAYDRFQSTGSFVKCDCSGFLEFNLGGAYEFSQDQMVSLDDPSQPVVAQFEINSKKWGEFIGQMSSMGNFTIPGLQGFDFEVSDAYLDFSTEENVGGVVFPPGYENVSPNLTNEWRGFFIRQIGLTLPEDFVLTPGTPRPNFTGSNLLIDPLGISTHLKGTDILDGDVEGWAFAMKRISVNIMANSLVESNIGGSIGIPIMDEDLPFVGSLDKDNSGFYTMMLKPDGDVNLNISALKSAINIGAQTEIVVKQIIDPVTGLKRFQPYADLYGGVGVTVTNSDFNDPAFTGALVQDVKTFVEETLNAPIVFDPPSINFEGFKINHPSQQDGVTFSLDDYLATGGLQIGSHELNLNQLDMLEAASMPFKVESDTLMLPGVGLGFRVSLPLVAFNVKFWAKEQFINGKRKYSFGKIELDAELPRLECGENLKEIELPANPILASGPIQNNFQTLEVGHFKLTPNFASLTDDNNGTITGTGTIEVPVLGPLRNLSVAFENIKVDSEGRIIEGEVITKTDDNFDPNNLSGVAGAVNTLMNKVGAGEIMNNLRLPLVMGVKSNGESERDQGLILVGLTFGPQEAKAKAKVVFDIGNGDYAEFVAEGLTIVPDGIANFDVAVGLASDLNFRPMPGVNLLVFKAYDKANEGGSFVKCDCSGFLEFNMEGGYEFPKEQMVSLDDPTQPITATFAINSKKWGEFIGEMGGMGNFTIPGLEGFDFVVSDAYLDFSTEENVVDVEFPEGYNLNVEPDSTHQWRGFFIKQIGLTLPEDFVLTPGAPRPNFTGFNLLIDPQGISTNLEGKNIMDGEVDGWAFAMDSITVNIMANSLVDSDIAGSVGVPMIDEELPFIGSLNKDISGFYKMMLKPDGDVDLNISALKSAINIGSQTEIVIQQGFDTLLNKKTFRPYADLWGGVGVTITNNDFNNPLFTGQAVQEAKGFVEDVLNAPIVFDPPSINFKGFKINHPSQPEGTTFSLDDYLATGGIQIGSFELNLNQLNMIQSDTIEFNIANVPTKLPGVGLSFKVSLPIVSFDVKFWAKEQIVNGKKKYSFGKIELEAELPRIECGDNLEEITVDQNGPLANGNIEGQFDALDVGHFKLIPEFTAASYSDDGQGTISGVGTIDVPVLGPLKTLNVAFENVKVNSEGRIIEGEVVTKTRTDINPEDLGGIAGAMNTLMAKVGAGNIATALSLPVVMGVKANGETERDQGLILVGLSFGPTEAKAKAKVVFDIENGDYAEFEANGLTIVPDGIANFDLAVGLASDLNFRPMPGINPLVFKAFDNVNNKGSFIKCDCSGFLELVLNDFMWSSI